MPQYNLHLDNIADIIPSVRRSTLEDTTIVTDDTPVEDQGSTIVEGDPRDGYRTVDGQNLDNTLPRVDAPEYADRIPKPKEEDGKVPMLPAEDKDNAPRDPMHEDPDITINVGVDVNEEDTDAYKVPSAEGIGADIAHTFHNAVVTVLQQPTKLLHKFLSKVFTQNPKGAVLWKCTIYGVELEDRTNLWNKLNNAKATAYRVVTVTADLLTAPNKSHRVIVPGFEGKEVIRVNSTFDTNDTIKAITNYLDVDYRNVKFAYLKVVTDLKKDMAKVKNLKKISEQELKEIKANPTCIDELYDRIKASVVDDLDRGVGVEDDTVGKEGIDLLMEVDIPNPVTEDGTIPDLPDASENSPDGDEAVVEEHTVNEDDYNHTDFIVRFDKLRNDARKYLAPLQLAYKNYRSGVLGVEGFTDTVKYALTGVVNIFGHIGNLFATGILYGWRDFKRGELTDYSDSNRLTMTRLYAIDNYERVRLMRVEHPKGMHGTYKDALKVITDCINELDMSKKSSMMVSKLDAIRADVKKKNTNFSSYVQALNQSFKPKYINDLFAKECKVFTTDRKDSDTFSKLFSSMKDFEDVCKGTMDLDSELRSVAGVHSRLQDMENIALKIVPMSEYLTAAQAEDIYKVVRTCAEIFDIYGTVINDLQRVNHNLRILVEDLRNKLDM